MDCSAHFTPSGGALEPVSGRLIRVTPPLQPPCNNYFVADLPNLDKLDQFDQWISVARIVRPQGRRGEVLAEITTDFPERFSVLREAFLQRRPDATPERALLEESWLHKGHIVLKFAGVDSISAAEPLRGAHVVIPADTRVELAPDEVYISDLIGCRLLDRAGGVPLPIGSIRDVIQQNGTADLLVVVADTGAEHWIPFARAYAPEVDLADRCVKMDLPPGILAMNAPLSEEERHMRQTENEPAEPATEET